MHKTENNRSYNNICIEQMGIYVYMYKSDADIVLDGTDCAKSDLMHAHIHRVHYSCCLT